MKSFSLVISHLWYQYWKGCNLTQLFVQNRNVRYKIYYCRKKVAMFSWFKTRDYVGDRVRPNSHHVFGLCWWNQSGYLEKKKKLSRHILQQSWGVIRANVVRLLFLYFPKIYMHFILYFCIQYIKCIFLGNSTNSLKDTVCPRFL